MNRVSLLLLCILTVQFVNAQSKIKFGKVPIEDLQEQFYPLDSTADAAMLYKRRWTTTSFGNNGLQMVTTIHKRIKIYSKDGFDWATERVAFFSKTKSSGESAGNFKAATYNLVDGKVVKTELDKDDIFSEQESKYTRVKSFTMPDVKEGCIVEWTYKIYSPYISSVDDVVLQYEIPVRRVDIKIELLEWFNFRKRQKGYLSFDIKESRDQVPTLTINNRVFEIYEEHIPALIEEPYVDYIHNYAAGLEFEVISVHANEIGVYENYSTSWQEIAKDIYNSDYFGGELNRIGHLKEDVAMLDAQLTTEPEKIIGGLQFVKSKIKWDDYYGEYPKNGLKTAYKEGKGNIGDINLTLVAVLRELGLSASPVLIITRSNGIPFYPSANKINYVIAAVETTNGTYLLDASEPYSLPNVLPLRALNWQGTLIRKNGTVSHVNLGSSLVSKEEANLSYKIDEDGFIEGMNRVKYSNRAAMDYRNSKGKQDQDQRMSRIEEDCDDIEILNLRINNVNDNIVKDVVEMYKFEKEDGVEVIGDKMYLQPMLFLAHDENPFKLEQREYPVDFGTPWMEKATCSIEIPEGYQVETMPEDFGFGLSNDMGKFIYKIEAQGTKIKLVAMVEMNLATVPSTYYHELKELLNQIVQKQTEKIVLSKI